MAGFCVGDGLRNNGGTVEAFGPRSVAWPNEGVCPIGTNNGLRVDPVTGKLWVPPDPIISEDAVTGAPRTIVPASTATVSVATLTLQQTARRCTRSFWLATLAGGYAGFRCASGNFWALERYATTYVNGAPVAFTGVEDVGAVENNSGGVLGVGGPVEALTLRLQLDPGDVVKVVAHYQLNPLAFTANAANAFAWRAPTLTGVIWSYP